MPMYEAGWATRLFNPETDFYKLLALRNELEALEPTDGDTSEAGLRAKLQWRGHDPARDRWFAVAPGEPERLIGYAWVFAQSAARVVGDVRVHPDWRRRGVGSALLAQAQARARDYGADHMTGGHWADAAPAHHFLLHHDFEPVGHNRFFTAPADVPLPQPLWPAGYTMRPYREVQDLSLLARACNRCYHDMWGHAENDPTAVDEARLAEGMRQSPEFYNPDAIFMAFAPDGDVVGVCYGRAFGHESNEPTTGRPKKVVDSPGVVPELRHLGLQRPLALATMRWLRQNAGPGPVELWTYGDQEEAVAIYKELGFTLAPNRHLIEYRLGL